MGPAERDRFDSVLERLLRDLPKNYRAMLEEAPLVVDDQPSPELLEQLGMHDDEILCGLHSGIPLTEQTHDQTDALPTVMHLFREDIVDHAGGWDIGDGAAVEREIRITLLHEMGHHFGLEEEDLRRLGYE